MTLNKTFNFYFFEGSTITEFYYRTSLEREGILLFDIN